MALGAYTSAGYGATAIDHSSQAYADGGVALGYGAQDRGTKGVLAYSGAPIFGGVGKSQRGFWVGGAIVSTTSATRLTGDGGAAASGNQPTPSNGGTMTLSGTILVHSTTSADAAVFVIDPTNPALFVRGSSGSPTLVSGTGTVKAVSASSGAGTVSNGTNSLLSVSLGVDNVNGTASCSVTAGSGSWHATAGFDAIWVD